MVVSVDRVEILGGLALHTRSVGQAFHGYGARTPGGLSVVEERSTEKHATTRNRRTPQTSSEYTQGAQLRTGKSSHFGAFKEPGAHGGTLGRSHT
jgi:hypothetical protein